MKVVEYHMKVEYINIRYRRRPNDVPILNSSLNDNWALLEPTETQIPNSMTKII